MKRLFCLLLFCLLGVGAFAAPPATYALDNTEVRDVHAGTLKRDYQIYVALPESYKNSKREYPVLFVTDANYAFPIVRNVAQRLAKHAGMEEVIVVGLSYAKGVTPGFSRRRDYTPTVPRKHAYRSDMPGTDPVFGEAAAYGQFITSEIMPLVAEHYRADMRRKIFVGHSYGSLLGLQIMLTVPRAFEHYILGSPSLWYDAGVMFEREKDFAKTNKDLAASVFFGIGAKEILPFGKKRARSENDADMVADLHDFDRSLKSRRYPGLHTALKIFADEDHASVFPLVVTHGLRAYLKEAK